MTKMTYVQALENAINGNINDETIERLNSLKVSLVKRAEKAKTTQRKPSKDVQENNKLRAEIVEWMKANVSEPLSSDEIAQGMGMDIRKVRALLSRCEGIEKIKVNSKVNKWAVRVQA